MIALISLLLSFHLLPLPVDQHAAPDAQEIEVVDDDLAPICEKFFEKPSSELLLKNHYSPADMADSGLYVRGVYYVYDLEGNKLGVLKTLLAGDQEDEKFFRDEVEALQKLQKIPFQHFHSVKLKGHVHGESTLVLAESLAKGKSINQLIKDYGKMSSLSAKQESFSQIEAAVKETGVALGELHAKSPKRKPSHLPSPQGIIHGDAHIGNIFYDNETNQVTFIDFQLTPPINQGGPVGTDLGQFLVSIELMSKYWHLSDHQIDQLKEAFLTAYQEHGPKISDEEISFYEDQVLKRYANMPEESLQGSEGHQARFIKDYSSFLIASSSSSSSSSVGSKS